MGICIYCDKDGKLTREHVFPDFIENKSTDKGVYYSGSADKYVPNAPVVKDVCSHCNNVILGNLDAYAAKLYDKYFSHEITSPITFKFESDMFIRWLIKVLFNAQRSFNGVFTNFLPYRKFMLGNDDSPRKVYILGCVMKSSRLNDENVRARDIRATDVRLPELKLGIQYSLSHVVTINSFSFMVLSFLREPSLKAFNRTLKFIKKNLGYTLSESSDNELKLNPNISKIDHVSHKGLQRYNNPNVFPNNGLITVGKEKIALTHFPEVPQPRIKVIDNKISLMTISDSNINRPFLGFKLFSKDLKEFSVSITANLDDLKISNRASVTVLRKGDKTFVTIHDKFEPETPILSPSSGIFQSHVNWNLWKQAIESNKCLYLYTGIDNRDHNSQLVHVKASILEIMENK
tara:strand:+ start:7543 stop:8754 length:1212 start_codon:yes stop_codon:yes gene_type:complete